MDERWLGSAFQMLETTDENNLEFAMVVLRGGTHIDNNEEERSARVGPYFGMRDARWDGCWNWSTFKVIVAILKLILWRTGSQCRSERTGVMRQNRGFWATTRARVFRTSWRRVRFETDVPARSELQKSSREPTIAAAIVFEASVVREARIWHNTRIWKKQASDTCLSKDIVESR